MNEYGIQIKYNHPRTGWEDIDRFVIVKDEGAYPVWPAFTVQQRLHNWLVMYFYNIKKGTK